MHSLVRSRERFELIFTERLKQKAMTMVIIISATSLELRIWTIELSRTSISFRDKSMRVSAKDG